MAESSPSTFIPWMASSPVNHKTTGGQSPAAAGRSPAKGKSPETNAYVRLVSSCIWVHVEADVQELALP
jgi:hypothetical protein